MLVDPRQFGQRYGAVPEPIDTPQAPAGMMFRGFGDASPAPQPSKTDRWFQFAGKLGDTLMALSGAPGAAQLAQQRQFDRRLEQQDRLATERLNRPVVQSTGNGGFAVINPVTGEVLNQQAGANPSDLQQRVEYLNTLKSGLGDTYAGNYAENGGGVPQLMNVPGVGIVAVPRGGGSTGGAPPASAPPSAPVGKLTPIPGGAPQAGARTFPIR